MAIKPFAQSCENNKAAILHVLEQYLEEGQRIFEIGSGTGQHAVFFANQFPKINWQPSELPNELAGIRLWSEDARHHNLLPPLELNVSHTHLWPEDQYDAFFSANTSHIMPIEDVISMFELVGKCLSAQGLFILYGPFNQHRRYTSESNHDFDVWLKGQSPHMGLREVESLETYAKQYGMKLKTIHDMPKNNKTLIFKKMPSRA